MLGRNQAPNAAEYVLHALAACLTSAIVYHAAAQAIEIDGIDCWLEGELDLRGFLGLPDVRPGYSTIRARFEIAGDFDDDQLAILAGFTRFSPVRDVVTNPVPVSIDVVAA